MENLSEAEIQLLIALLELEEAFVAEGNAFLYENLLQESEAATKAFDPDTWPASRFLYHVPIGEEETIP